MSSNENILILKTAFIEYKNDLKELIKAYRAICVSDAFVNILEKKIGQKILKEKKVYNLLSKVVKVYPDKYINDLFFVRLVTLLEEYLKNRMLQAFDQNEDVVKHFLTNYITDRKLTTTDVINGPKKLAILLLDEIIFHNMPKVEKVYFATFRLNIKELCDFKKLILIVRQRHILIHNGGKGKSKEKIKTFRLQSCLDEINKLVENIEFHLIHNRAKKVIRRVDIESYGLNEFVEDIDDLIEYDMRKAFDNF